MSDENPIINLAIGRIFRLLSRPYQPGDIEDYERCRALIIDSPEYVTYERGSPDHQPNYARDRLRGAQGD